MESFASDDRYQNALIHNALDVLLHCKETNITELLIALEVNGIILGSGAFAMVAFQPKNLNDEPETSCLQKFHMLLKLVQKEFGANCVNYPFMMDGEILALCCFPRHTKSDRRELEIQDLLMRLSQQVMHRSRSEQGFETICSIGSIGYGTECLPRLFQTVTDHLEFVRFMEAYDIQPVKQQLLRPIDMLENSSFIHSQALSMAGRIKTNAIGSVSNAVSSFVHGITETGTSSIRHVHFSLLLFCDTLNSELIRLDAVDSAFLKKQNMLGRLYQAQTARELIDILVQQINEILVYMDKRADNYNVALMNRVRSYVSEHFTDQNLSVSSIANAVGLRQAVLSSMFKTYCGTNLLSYIRTHRVDSAKCLLRQGLSLEEVAQSVGFGCLNTMYRAFKTVEGVPPGSFRESP